MRRQETEKTFTKQTSNNRKAKKAPLSAAIPMNKPFRGYKTLRRGA